MATAPQWPVLAEMGGGGSWPALLEEYAAALPTDAPIDQARGGTVTETHEAALGCAVRR